jgi:hypothetical protein
MHSVSDVVRNAVGNVVAEWRTRAAGFAEVTDTVRVSVLQDVLAAVERALHGAEERTVNLTMAARLSGYSATHLGRLVRDGKLPNAGRPNAPKLRLCDLPRKSPPLAQSPSAALCIVRGSR